MSLLRSGREEDADGTATDLLDRFETWEAVLEQLEAEYHTLDAKIVSAFIENLGILDPSNRRPIGGKAFDDIKRDAKHFKMLAQRAACLYKAA